MSYAVELTEEALVMLKEIQDRRVQKSILDRIGKLADEPEKQGKPLVGELAGFRSIRAVGQRYRVVFEIQGDVVKVIVVGIGLRKAGHRGDIYARMAHLFQKD